MMKFLSKIKLFSTTIILLVSPFYLDATSIDIPDSPIIKRILCNKKDAVISWEPKADNGSPIRRYDVQYNTSYDPFTWQTVYNQRDTLLSNLTYVAALPPGVKQSFRVIAWNDVGPSEPSSPSDICTTAPDVPYKNPENVYGEGSEPDNLVINWTPMQQIEHNGPGFQYQVHWRKKGEQTFFTLDVTDWRDSFVVIPDQPSYQQYDIKVQAMNERGIANVAPVEVTGYSGEDIPLEAPTNFKLTQIVSPNKALVTWDSVPPDSIRGKFMGYKITTWSEKTQNHHQTGLLPTAQTALLTYLVPYEKNYVQISVFNSKHIGPPSETISFVMPEGAPDQISALDVHPLGASALYLNWKKPEHPNGVITGYNIYYAPINRTSINDLMIRTPPIKDPNQLQAKLAGLIPNTVYHVFVTAVNAAGESPRHSTETKTGNTEPSVPSVPSFTWQYLTIGNDTATVKITWLPNLEGNPGNDFYIKYKKENDNTFIQTAVGMFEDYIVVEVELDHVYEFAVVAIDGNYHTASALQKVYVDHASKTRE